MNRFAACMAMAGLLVLGVGTAYAALDDSPQQQQGQPTKQQDPKGVTGKGAGATAQPGADQMGQVQVFRSDQLIGKKVTNAQGEDLGTIRDVVLMHDRTTVSYLVLGHGGVAGVGDKLFAVPFSAFDTNTKPGAEKLTLNISKQTLDQNPGFKSDSYPMQADYSLFGGTRSMGTGMPMKSDSPAGGAMDKSKDQTGAGAGATDEQGQTRMRDRMHGQWGMAGEQTRFRRVSQYMGLDVKNRQNAKLGDLEDLAIARTQQGEGQVIYGIVSYGGTLGVGEKNVAIPWTAIILRPAQDMAVVDADATALDSLAFTGDNYPDLASRDYGQKAAQQFDTQPYWEVFGFAPVTKERSTQAWIADSNYLKNYDARNVQTIQGKIFNIGMFCPEAGSMLGLRLRVRSDQGQIITVHAGPWNYAQQQGMVFNVGQPVTVKGAKITFMERNVIMANQITSEGKTLNLLDDQGKPQWNAQQLGQMEQTGAGAGATEQQTKDDLNKAKDAGKEMQKDIENND